MPYVIPFVRVNHLARLIPVNIKSYAIIIGIIILTFLVCSCRWLGASTQWPFLNRRVFPIIGLVIRRCSRRHAAPVPTVGDRNAVGCEVEGQAKLRASSHPFLCWQASSANLIPLLSGF